MKNINLQQNKWAALGAFLAMASVAAGAFGAHLLENKLPFGKLEVFNTAARYQMYHALAIIIVAVLALPQKKIVLWLFTLGILFFSGGLYAYSLSYLFYDYGYEFLGILAPIGGLCFLLAWLILALRFLSNKH